MQPNNYSLQQCSKAAATTLDLLNIHLLVCLCVQEAQRAAKAANTGKHIAGKKQKETSATKEEEKKLTFTKMQTTSSNMTKSDISVAGKLMLVFTAVQ